MPDPGSPSSPQQRASMPPATKSPTGASARAAASMLLRPSTAGRSRELGASRSESQPALPKGLSSPIQKAAGSPTSASLKNASMRRSTSSVAISRTGSKSAVGSSASRSIAEKSFTSGGGSSSLSGLLSPGRRQSEEAPGFFKPYATVGNGETLHKLSTKGVFDLLDGLGIPGMPGMSSEASQGPGSASQENPSSARRGYGNGSASSSGTKPPPKKKAQSLQDCDSDSDEEADSKKVSGASIVLQLIASAPDRAHGLFYFLKLRDIVYFHFANVACRNFCIHPTSRKLIVPLLRYHWKWMDHVHLPTVEILEAERISAARAKENETIISKIQDCIQLRILYLCYNQTFAPDHFSMLLERKPHLKILDLAHNNLASLAEPEKMSARVFSCLPTCLKVVYLNHNGMEDVHLKLLCKALDDLGVRLEKLYIRSNYFEDGAGWSLAGYLNSPSGVCLSHLDLRANRIAAQGAQRLLAASASHRELKELRLGYNTKMGYSVSSHVAKLLASKKSGMVYLDIANADMGDTGAVNIGTALTAQCSQFLIHLELSWNGLSSDGVASIALGLGENEFLQILDLRDNKAGNLGAKALATSLRRNRTLQKLLLARNDIEDAGAGCFIEMLEDNSFVNLDLNGNDISHNVKMRLRRHLLVISNDLKI